MLKLGHILQSEIKFLKFKKIKVIRNILVLRTRVFSKPKFNSNK